MGSSRRGTKKMTLTEESGIWGKRTGGVQEVWRDVEERRIIVVKSLKGVDGKLKIEGVKKRMKESGGKEGSTGGKVERREGKEGQK